MMVIILKKAPARLRGELTRWLIEPRPGVVVDRVSADQDPLTRKPEPRGTLGRVPANPTDPRRRFLQDPPPSLIGTRREPPRNVQFVAN